MPCHSASFPETCVCDVQNQKLKGRPLLPGTECALRLDVKCQRLWERFWTNRKQKIAETSQEILLYVPSCGMLRVRKERKAVDHELKPLCKGKQ